MNGDENRLRDFALLFVSRKPQLAEELLGSSHLAVTFDRLVGCSVRKAEPIDQILGSHCLSRSGSLQAENQELWSFKTIWEDLKRDDWDGSDAKSDLKALEMASHIKKGGKLAAEGVVVNLGKTIPHPTQKESFVYENSSYAAGKVCLLVLRENSAQSILMGLSAPISSPIIRRPTG